MGNPEELKRYAENCAELADAAKDEPAKRRFKRMEKAYTSLAEAQCWLDGKKVESRTEK